MNRLFLFALALTLLGTTACSFHEKQPIDDTYYKRSQSVAWPED